MADQICYAILCVFSYVAAGQNKANLDCAQPAAQTIQQQQQQTPTTTTSTMEQLEQEQQQQHQHHEDPSLSSNNDG